MIQRVIEWCAVLFLLIIFLPIFIVLSLFIVLESQGPVFFIQPRVGLHGRVFDLIKFRSMVKGAELLAADKESVILPAMKPKNDHRVTSVGRWLRRFSLDELPQLINVLRGEMALIGPRPHLPEELAFYGEQEYRRLSIKPGMTGLWQVSGRAEKSFAEQMELDLYYVDHRNWRLNLGIFLKTVPAVLFGRGAY